MTEITDSNAVITYLAESKNTFEIKDTMKLIISDGNVIQTPYCEVCNEPLQLLDEYDIFICPKCGEHYDATLLED